MTQATESRKSEKDGVERGYAAGHYFMATKPGVWWWWDLGTAEAAEFAVQVIARTSGSRPATAADAQRRDGWILAISASENRLLHLRIDSTGTLFVQPLRQIVDSSGKTVHDLDEKSLLRVSPIRHKAIRPHGEFNSLLVISRGRKLDLFVNGERVVREPISLPDPLGPGSLFFGLSALGVPERLDGLRVEVERFTLWSLTPVTGKDK